MTAYKIEILKNNKWEFKDLSHSKIPSLEKALIRQQQLIYEGQSIDSIRVVEDIGEESPLDTKFNSQP